VCMCISVSVCERVCVYECVCVNICVCVCAYACKIEVTEASDEEYAVRPHTNIQ
jgi:hypothetical protein